MRRRSSNTVKTLHSGHTFTSRDSFPPGVLPTKRQVIERILHLKNFRTETVANDIAEEIHDRWIWCNVYPVHKYTISKKVQNLVASFSSLDRWTKSRRGNTFLQRESEFMQTIDSLFDVFCVDDQQRKNLEKQHGLRMAEADYAFYQDQKSERVGKCKDTVVPLSSSDKMFLRRHPQSTEPTCSSTETAAPSTSACGYVSDCSSVQTEHLQSSTTSEFVPDAESFSQNRMKWSNLARMSERFQVSDRAAAAIANSVMQDLGFITENDKTYVIDRSKLRREREQCRTDCTNVLPPQRGGAVPSPMGMGRNGRTDLPRGSTERSPPLSRTVFSLGRPLTGHNWAAPLLLIDRTPFQRLLILALLLISGNVHPNPGPISNHPHPRYPCSICHLDVGRDSLQCSACLKWVHFLCSSLTRADFRTICATGTSVGWRCPACHPQITTGSPTQTSLHATPPASPPPPPPGFPHYRLAFTNHVHLRAPHVTLAPLAPSRLVRIL